MLGSREHVTGKALGRLGRSPKETGARTEKRESEEVLKYIFSCLQGKGGEEHEGAKSKAQDEARRGSEL